MDRWAVAAVCATFCATLGAFAAPAAAEDELCADPQSFCGQRLSPTCLSSYGAGSLAAAPSGDCESQFAAYRECLASVAETCGGSATLNLTQQDAAQSLEGLDRLGGLIPEPETVVEHYNNAFVYERRGDALNSRKMYEKAIALGAEAVDLHLRYLALL
ncbi:MAG: hypothetical protein AAFR16_14295, partial [Pseudomonadota bacterium]